MRLPSFTIRAQWSPICDGTSSGKNQESNSGRNGGCASLFLMTTLKNPKNERPRIAMPEPCSYDSEYSNRALPAYLRAIEAAGGEPVVIPLASSPEEIARQITNCSGVLLPGSKADVDPQKFSAQKHARTAPADPLRDAADELLLQDAYNLRKPVLVSAMDCSR